MDNDREDTLHLLTSDGEHQFLPMRTRWLLSGNESTAGDAVGHAACMGHVACGHAGCMGHIACGHAGCMGHIACGHRHAHAQPGIADLTRVPLALPSPNASLEELHAFQRRLAELTR